MWTGSNLDTSRLATRWAKGHPGATRCILLALLTLRGTPVIYQGDEIGLPRRRDDPRGPPRPHRPALLASRHRPRPRALPDALGRWSRPRLQCLGPTGPVVAHGHPAQCNVAAQRDDPRSVLTFTRDLIVLRRSSADLHSGAYRSVASPPGTWVWQRGHGFATALNLGEESCAVSDLIGSVAIGTDHGHDGEPVEGRLRTRPRRRSLVRLA